MNRNQGKKETAYGYKSKSGIRRKKRQKRKSGLKIVALAVYVNIIKAL